MKKLSGIILFLSVFVSCTKDKLEKATIVRDCTGTYIHVNKVDYRVCNLDMLSSFADGAEVTVAFDYITACDDPSQPQIVCMMYHQNEGWVKITQVK